MHGGSRVRGLRSPPQKCSPLGWEWVLGSVKGPIQVQMSQMVGRPGTWEMSPLRYLTSPFTWLSPLCFSLQLPLGAFLDFSASLYTS